jgi:hypothetical protein
MHKKGVPPLTPALAFSNEGIKYLQKFIIVSVGFSQGHK